MKIFSVNGVLISNTFCQWKYREIPISLFSTKNLFPLHYMRGKGDA